MSFDRNVDNVCKMLQDRAWTGLRKYGVTTERTDIDVVGWLQHLQEELCDAAVYIERLKGEYVQGNTKERQLPWQQQVVDLLYIREDEEVHAPLPAGLHWGLGACNPSATSLDGPVWTESKS